MTIHFVVATTATLDPETPVEGVFPTLGEAVQAATGALASARYTRAAPKYVYSVEIIPQMIARQDVSVVTEAVDAEV